MVIVMGVHRISIMVNGGHVSSSYRAGLYGDVPSENRLDKRGVHMPEREEYTPRDVVERRTCAHALAQLRRVRDHTGLEVEDDVIRAALLALFVNMDRVGPHGFLEDAGLGSQEERDLFLSTFSRLRKSYGAEM